MLKQQWWQTASVVDQLVSAPHSFEFMQSVRLFRHASMTDSSGSWADGFRFRNSVELSFPVAEIESLNFEEDKVIVCNLLVGLTGMLGALPYSYTSKIRQLSLKQRQPINAFMELFNHRLTAQYVDASMMHHLALRYELEQENHYQKILHALNGYVSHQHDQPDFDDYFAEFSGLMQGQNNTAYAIKTMLNGIFRQHVQIKEWVSEKFYFETSQINQLGVQQTVLGMDMFCGSGMVQPGNKLEIIIGPMTRQEYQHYLPGNKNYRLLEHIFHSWLSPELAVDLRLILNRQETSALKLGIDADTGLAHGAFLMATELKDNEETRYPMSGVTGHA